VEHAFWHSGRLILHFKDVHDRSAAEELRGVFLVVDSEISRTSRPRRVPRPRPGRLAAVDPSGAALGTLTAVDHVLAATCSS